jgi:hypothetical protein
MARAVRLVRDDAYEEMGAAYQCVLTGLLDAALRRQVKSADVRRKIAERFVFALGEFHDTGWFRPSGRAAPVYPVLCFGERFLNVDTEPADLGTVYAPSPSFAFHEYAHGSVEAYYDDDPAAQVETGQFGGES